MRILDLARAYKRQWRHGVLPAATARQLYPRGVVFVHVPKCGGTSVEQGLRAAYPLSRFRIHAEGSATVTAALWDQGEPTTRDLLGGASEVRTMVLKYALGCGYACITGHAPLARGVIGAFRESHDFVTILRDPISRFKSHYMYSFRNGRHGSIEEPIEDFISTDRARDLGSLFLKYYSLENTYRPFDAAKAIESAKATLSEMSVVGFVDQMDAFADDLVKLGRKVRIGHANKGANEGGKKQIFTPEVMAEVEALCAADLEVYRWARERFARG